MSLAKPTSVHFIKEGTDRVRRLLTNATIDLPEYADPAFRLHNIKEAITLLQFLECRLVSDVAIQNMKEGTS